MYISVQMLDLTAIWKENNCQWNLVTSCMTLKAQVKFITWIGALLVFSCVRRLMILPYSVCTHSNTHTRTHNDHQLRPRSVTQPWIIKYVLYGVMLTEREREKWICTHRQTYPHLPLFTRESQSNRLLVSGSVWWDLELGPWNLSLDETITLNFLPKGKLTGNHQT